MSREYADVAIIGGGAAGLAAAVMLGRVLPSPGYKIIVLEKQARVGRKLLATGNGTCNISNINADRTGYHSGQKDFARPALEQFPPDKACAFFNSIGVFCKAREDGKIYPLSLQASSVVDCLRLQLRACGVEELCGCRVTKIKPLKDKVFLLNVESGGEHAGKGHNNSFNCEVREIKCRVVVNCCGGTAAPSLGGCADGYNLLSSLGHQRTELLPSVVKLKTVTDYTKALQGIRVEGTVSLFTKDKLLGRCKGEILFADYGLSGPAVLQISRWAAVWQQQKKWKLEAAIDLLPDFTTEQLETILAERRQLPGAALEDYLTGLLNKRLGQTVLRSAGLVPLSRLAAELHLQDICRLAEIIKDWRFEVVGVKGWGDAQVTAGGLECEQFDRYTMQSKLIEGLYAAGEVLDVDGDCGGFNLQWAWSSAYLAAKDISKKIKTEKSPH